MEQRTRSAQMLGFDWAQAWSQMDALRERPADAASWDERAATFPTKHGAQTGYVKRFLELAGVQPGETVLDMGCGTGALATPLALAGNPVIACDFSRGMLEKMRADQQALGVECARVEQMSWEDDWEAFGLAPGCADVALASRSIATADLETALLKLTGAARRRVCITLAASLSPRLDDELLEVVGFGEHRPPDYVYAFNILLAHGFRPTVDYIENTRMETFDTREEAVGLLWDLVAQCSSLAAEDLDEQDGRSRIGAWLDAGNLVANPNAGAVDKNGVAQKALCLARPRSVAWAFLAWDL